MKNLHKVALSILVGVLAITFSAFKSANDVSTTARYYNNRADHAASTNPADFIYVDGSNLDCASGATKQCALQWTTTNAPVAGQTPTQAGSPSIVPGSSEAGIYNK